MKYAEFIERDHFELKDLIAFSHGTLVEDPPDGFDAHLPAPPFLMMDRVTSLKSNGARGSIVAEQDIRLDAWYFQCHFRGDPVQPGCLCVDAIWQLLGFYCVWRGSLGAGRALGCEEISFDGQIRPYNKCVRYEIDVKRYFHQKEFGTSVVVGDGKVFVDDELITVVRQARSGIFSGITYQDYPNRSSNSVGGIVKA